MRQSESLLRESFGLTTYEARVYVALLGRRMAAKEASKAADVPMPRVYDTLRNLVSKGFVKETPGGYLSVDPAVALETRMNRFDAAHAREQSVRAEAKRRIIEELHWEPGRLPEEASEPVLLRGLDGIGSAFIETLEGRGDAIILVRKAMKAKAEFIGMIAGLPARRKRIRIVLPVGTRLTEEDSRFAREHSLKIRYSEPSALDLMVAGDRDVILGVPTESSDEPFAAMAVWVRNKEFAESARRALEDAWRLGRKAPS